MEFGNCRAAPVTGSLAACAANADATGWVTAASAAAGRTEPGSCSFGPACWPGIRFIAGADDSGRACCRGSPAAPTRGYCVTLGACDERIDSGNFIGVVVGCSCRCSGAAFIACGSKRVVFPDCATETEFGI